MPESDEQRFPFLFRLNPEAECGCAVDMDTCEFLKTLAEVHDQYHEGAEGRLESQPLALAAWGTASSSHGDHRVEVAVDPATGHGFMVVNYDHGGEPKRRKVEGITSLRKVLKAELESQGHELIGLCGGREKLSIEIHVLEELPRPKRKRQPRPKG